MIMLSPLAAGLEKGSSIPVVVVCVSSVSAAEVMHIFDQPWKTNITFKLFLSILGENCNTGFQGYKLHHCSSMNT